MMNLILVLLLALPGLARDGTEISGGGGNGAEAEFRTIGNKALEALANRSLLSYRLIAKFDALKAQTMFKTTKIDVIKDRQLVLNGKNVSAINYPSNNKIELGSRDWQALDKDGKLRLVIHELIGLTHRGVLDDSDYSASETMRELVLRSGLESVALQAARLNNWRGDLMRVQTNRTKVARTYVDEQGEDVQVTEVYVQTFENSSPQAVRVYHIYEDFTGGLIKLEFVNAEGPVGP